AQSPAWDGGVADPWPLNERSVLYQWLSALVSRALAENMKGFLQAFLPGVLPSGLRAVTALA
ncbi:hypothetical protein, partial [Arthrobacter sp.]|uniref:hypothetical protein n=1 Tax=Arthrobacter sp. TaxID=1667 RepID=UPI003397684D